MAAHYHPVHERTRFDDGIYRRVVRKRLLGAEQEMILIERAQTGDARAMHELVTRNLRFIYKVSARFLGHDVLFEDLVEAGITGYVMAILRFRSDKTARLATYAAWWIRHHCRRAIADSRLVRVSTTNLRREVEDKLRKTEAALTKELERQPTLQEIADRLAVPVSDVVAIDGSIRGHVSLNRPAWDEQGQTRQDLVTDDRLGPDGLTEAAQSGRRLPMLVAKALTCLDKREALVIRRRFLMDGPDTLQQIGDDLGLKRETVRQTQNRALIKMRDWLTDQGYADECLDVLASLAELGGYDGAEHAMACKATA